MSDRVLTMRQLAAKWGWSYQKLYRLVQTSAIPHLRLGPRRDIHFREATVEAWLKAQEVTPKTAPAPQVVSDDAADAAWRREMGVDDEHQFT